MAEPPARVAIADGVATEIAYRLGAGDRIVGVDQTSIYPPEARRKPQLGYFRRLSAEGLLSLTPDLLIATPHAGPPAALEQARSAGVEVVVTPDVLEVNEVPTKVLVVGRALGLEAAAEALAAEVKAEIDALAASMPDRRETPKVLFVLTVRNSAPLVAGTATGPDAVIRAAGGRNVAGFENYKPMAREEIAAAEPDLVLMTEEHSAPLGGVAAVLALPEFASTPAGQAGRGLTRPALTLLSLGPRTPATVAAVRAALPE
ncbi:MAG: ABC transporter substrate-binding protein [Alphaproteobacteria bacterium]